MGRDYPQFGRSRCYVYVILPLFLLDVLTHLEDYYYYATAGGAKFWVRFKFGVVG